MKTNSTKQHLKVVAKELGVPKSTPKKMIKDKEISFELINGQYYIDADEVREALKTKKSAQRKTIFTVNRCSSETIIKDLTEISKAGSKAFIGLGSFDGPIQMAEVAKKNGYKIDQGAIISEDMAPLVYAEMALGTASESSPGNIQLDNAISSRLAQDWDMWILQAERAGNHIGFGIVDAYFASTTMEIARQIKASKRDTDAN